MSHLHICPRCGRDWECDNGQCVGAVALVCDACAEEEDREDEER